MIKEAQDYSEVDAIREREENRVWEKRDAELRAQTEARRRLMEIVHAGRQEQIKAKRERDAIDRILEEEQERNDAAELQKGLQMDREAAEKRGDAQDNNTLLLKQIAMREQALDELERERQEAEKWRATCAPSTSAPRRSRRSQVVPAQPLQLVHLNFGEEGGGELRRASRRAVCPGTPRVLCFFYIKEHGRRSGEPGDRVFVCVCCRCQGKDDNNEEGY